MIPYTGEYIGYKENDQSGFTYYSFTPASLMAGNFYTIDDELIALLNDTYQKLGFLDGVIQYAPNKNSFRELMLFKECVYSKMIDYGDPSFEDALAIRGSGKGDITPITNLMLAFEDAACQGIYTQELNKVCEIALYGEEAKEAIDIRRKQIFLSNVKANIKIYNPTAPDALLPALADIFAFLRNSQEDMLIKIPLVHYQFEMLHPYEKYNGIVGRIMVSQLLSKIVNEAFSLICFSEFLYWNKNQYFDLLSSTRRSGGHIRWIKFFVNAINEATRLSAQLLMQYEDVIAFDEKKLSGITPLPKSVSIIYDCLKKYPIINVPVAEKLSGLSFNTVSKALLILEKNGIVKQCGNNGRNRIFEHTDLKRLFTDVK